MHRVLAVAAAILLMAPACSADTFTVTTDANSGPGSLRWAMEQANENAGADTIAFSQSMIGAVIRPTGPLPVLENPGTTIDGDVDNDGGPDITLDGRSQGDYEGIRIRLESPPVLRPRITPRVPTRPGGILRRAPAAACTIRGLVFSYMKKAGVNVQQSDHVRIVGCNFGVARDGQTLRLNHYTGVLLVNSDSNIIGGTSLADRNVFVGLDVAGNPKSAISITDGKDNRVYGNCFGLTRDGNSSFRALHALGISISGGSGNMIGGSQPGQGNLFCDLDGCVRLSGGAQDCVIAGNSFGLMQDGTEGTIRTTCVSLQEDAHGNTIGGTDPGAGNVFGGLAPKAIQLWAGGNVKDNVIAGNYFGMTADGDLLQRPPGNGVKILTGAGAQTIGGFEQGARNFFVCSDTCVYMTDGQGTRIINNTFGCTPNGYELPEANRPEGGIQALNVELTAMGNIIYNMRATGIRASGNNAHLYAYANSFRMCGTAIMVRDGAHASLGDVRNADDEDDGWNVFEPNCEWAIRNLSSNPIRAEGNEFATTSAAEIDARIYDQKDHADSGLVDYAPLRGGVEPTE